MEEALGESLIDKGQKEKISELSERYSKLITLTERDGFLQGFRLGAKLMAELMAEKNWIKQWTADRARTGASDPLFLFIKPYRIRDRISFSLCTEDFSAPLRRQNMRRQSKKNWLPQKPCSIQNKEVLSFYKTNLNLWYNIFYPLYRGFLAISQASKFAPSIKENTW